MSIYCEKIMEMKFSNEVSKKAYLEACKWLALNVFGKPDYSKYIVVDIQKQTKKTPSFIVTLYIRTDEEEFKKQFCSKCKQLHTIFYSIDSPSCEQCKLTAYRKKIKDDMKNLRKYFEEIMEDFEDE